MKEFNKNTEQVLNYLNQKNACNAITASARNCFRQLGSYLSEKALPYSRAVADEWISAVSDKYARDTISNYQNALNKLDDVYLYGEVRHLTRFKCDGTYIEQLCSTLRQQLESFLVELSDGGRAEATVLNYKIEGSRILLRLQKQYGIESLCSITYGVVISFYNNGSHESQSAKRFENEVFARILCFTHQKWGLPFGYTILIHYLSLGKGAFWNDISPTAIEEIRSLQTVAGALYTLGEFLVAQGELKEIHLREKYSKEARTAYNKWLGALYLFLEMNGFSYTADSAHLWYTSIRNVSERERRTAKRALCLMEQRLSTGKTDLSVMFLEKPNAFLRLPLWCMADVGSFLSMKEAEGWETSTLCMYRSAVCRFCMFLDSIGVKSFSEMTAGHIKEFNKKDEHKTPAGKNAYNSRIRKFLFFLGETRILHNPMLFAALPSASAPKETLVITLTEEELESVRLATHEDSDILNLREKAVLLLGLRLGIRSSDIVQLLLDDIDWDRATLSFIQEKTNVEVTLPMPTDAANALYRYLTMERPQTECRNVFIRERAPYHPVGRSACQKALQAALPERDVPGSGFHVTRKTYATSLLRGGAGINMVAEALGQTGTGSVHRYLSLDEKRMRMCPLSLESTGLLLKGGL